MLGIPGGPGRMRAKAKGEEAGVGLGRPQGGLGDLGAPRWGVFWGVLPTEVLL